MSQMNQPMLDEPLYSGEDYSTYATAQSNRNLKHDQMFKAKTRFVSYNFDSVRYKTDLPALHSHLSRSYQLLSNNIQSLDQHT